MNRVDRQNGFTSIELMLAMAFVSALLIAVAMTVIQIASIYNRGITLKDVNQTGSSVASELQRSISGSASFNINPGPGSRFIVQDWGGRLCLGQYSYIWNYGKDIQTGDTSRLNVYLLNPTNPIRLVKVIDSNISYCTLDIISGKYPSIKSIDAVELLNAGEHDLALHSFNISTTSTATDTRTGQELYTVEFLLGTNNQAALIGESADTECRPPSDEQSDPSYCSVNQFNIVARAGNAVK